MQTRFWQNAQRMAMVLCLVAMPAFAWAQQQGSSQQTGDPVADAARKARAEKKNAAKAKRVFTDDDVKPAIPAPSEKPAEGSDAAEKGAQKEGDAGKEDPNGEKAWRKRFADQRAKIDKAQMELDVLQRELEKSQVQYYSDPQKALAEQNNRSDINETSKNIEIKKKELEHLRQQLDDLEDELRKSGGDPSWGR